VDFLETAISAVTVYPDGARVTRRAKVRLPAGQQRVLLGPLPLNLQQDSIRVAGRGPATVLGVDLETVHEARTGDQTAVELEQRRRTLAGEIAALDDADGVQQQRAEFLGNLAQRAGGTYAHALASGGVDPAGVTVLADALTEQLTAVRARRRELGERRDLLRDELAAVERRLSKVGEKRRPDRMGAAIGLEVGSPDADLELEVSYLVGGARWESTYDIRLDAGKLTLTWYGLVTQGTGEDWPECELLLSTARPSTAVAIPELDPWYLDRVRDYGMARAMVAAAAPAPGASFDMDGYAAEEAAPMVEAVATLDQGVAAATYRPARPIAVPADRSPHRATVAVLDLEAKLDYVTAPVRGPEAHLRATVTNGSPHTLLPGKAAVFHAGDFVGSTQLASWAPGEEVELALGVDDRLRVERKLVRREASKATLGSTRRREVEYSTKVSNHTPQPARVTVLDQVPVSRDEQIGVKELRTDPAPAERTDLGVLTWKLELAPGASAEVRLGYRVELMKGAELAGWRE
jgi:uncharacterized protein (TIGR02231 family)